MAKRHDILLLNGDEKSLQTTRKVLTEGGYAVHASTTMREALGKLSAESIGLIICDVALQDTPIPQFLKFLRENPVIRTVPFVFYISLENQKYLRPLQAIDLKAKDYMIYPMAAEDFLNRIHEILPPRSDAPENREAPAKTERYAPRTEQPPAENTQEPRDKHFDFLSPIKITITKNEKHWFDSLLVNFNQEQALIQTPLFAKVGDIIKMKCALAEGETTSAAEVIHVVSGDAKGQAGILVKFKEDSKWDRMYDYLKPDEGPLSDDKQTETDSSQPQVEPDKSSDKTASAVKDQKTLIKNKSSEKSKKKPPGSKRVQLSRDGLFWMPGQIIHFKNQLAMFAASILAKTGDDIRIKYTSREGPIVVVGKVEKVTLDDLHRPAAIQIRFPKKSEWQRLVEDLGPLDESSPREKIGSLVSHTRIEYPLSRKRMEQPDKENKETEKTMVDTLVKRARSTKNRFFQSLIGKQLDNYIVNAFIDSGGMGGVFKGWDVALERDVALKVISYDLSCQKKFIDMFFREARFVSQLNHPHIAQIYYIGKSNDILYYAMEFINGQTLRELIQKGTPLSLKDKVKCFKTVCLALDFVWQKKIIHRDIKPENIMMDKKGFTKIVDFGVAKRFRDGISSKRQQIIGSPRYLSPETILGNPFDQRSDIYSLGATCYYLLTNSPPFGGQSIDVVLYKHINEKVVPPHQRNPDIPVPLSRIIEKMLAKNPDERYQDYRSIIRELNRNAHLWKN